MSKIFKPRRGIVSVMTGSKAATVLSKGEMFMECPDTGVGTGKSKIKMGDGVTPYVDLPYAIAGMDPDDPIELANKTYTDQTTALNDVKNGNSLKTVLNALKSAVKLNADAVNTLNDDTSSLLSTIDNTTKDTNTKLTNLTTTINTINTNVNQIKISTGASSNLTYKDFTLSQAVAYTPYFNKFIISGNVQNGTQNPKYCGLIKLSMANTNMHGPVTCTVSLSGGTVTITGENCYVQAKVEGTISITVRAVYG